MIKKKIIIILQRFANLEKMSVDLTLCKIEEKCKSTVRFNSEYKSNKFPIKRFTARLLLK